MRNEQHRGYLADRFRPGSWSPSKKKWKNACRKALAADPNSPDLYIVIQGRDEDLAKSDPLRDILSSLVHIEVEP